MRDIPRVVWVLAAGRFASSASTFLMLFLPLPHRAARPPGGHGRPGRGGYGVGLLARQLHRRPLGRPVRAPPQLMLCSTVSGLGVAAVPWLPTAALAVLLPVFAYLAATAAVSNGALAALAVRPRRPASSVAIGRAASNAGFVIGPPLGALIVSSAATTRSSCVDGPMTLAVRFAVAPFLPRRVARRADPDAPSLWRALRADRALMTLLPAVVLVDVVYRQLYTTVPVHLRDAGQPVALYTALVAVGSGLILALEIPVALRLRGHSSYPIIATGYGLVGVGFALFGLPVSAAGVGAGDGGPDGRRDPLQDDRHRARARRRPGPPGRAVPGPLHRRRDQRHDAAPRRSARRSTTPRRGCSGPDARTAGRAGRGRRADPGPAPGRRSPGPRRPSRPRSVRSDRARGRMRTEDD